MLNISVKDINKYTKSDEISKQYSRPSLIDKRQKTRKARFIIMDTIAHIALIITILCLIYIYQDQTIYRTYEHHDKTLFKSFKKLVGIQLINFNEMISFIKLALDR